jgi:hypothetical protein
MPGSCLANITALAHEEILNPTSDDAAVIWGGSNDVNRNETSLGLKHLKNFINHRSNTNILGLAAPYRHDFFIHSFIHLFSTDLLQDTEIVFKYVFFSMYDRASFNQVNNNRTNRCSNN